jgi:hypothetical protein
LISITLSFLLVKKIEKKLERYNDEYLISITIGPFVKALDLVDFMDTPDIRAQSGRTK